MTFFLIFLLIVAVAGCAALAVLWWQERSNARAIEAESTAYRTKAEQRRAELEAATKKLKAQVDRLARWTAVADADDKAKQLLASAQAALAKLKTQAQGVIKQAQNQRSKILADTKVETAKITEEAEARAAQLTEEAQAALATATQRSGWIIAEANLKAEQIAGKAYDVVRDVDAYKRTAKAMKNIIEGYGDEYLVPAESLLDELAEAFAHKDAGRQLNLARNHTKSLIKESRAAKCEYVEVNRREGAERFVIDAFNGKVDSILSRVRHDNYGKLEAQIKDAFTIVNLGGRPIKDARITDEYLAARLAELKWATIAQELKKQEKEEQRQIREQIREEEKARKEFEKAIKEAAKEEDMLRKAMAQAQAQIDAATAEQRAQYEAQLAELNTKLQEAEERNQRAISMAQQTKRGHVYIISNVGSFGENIYKIGLTRRLEPLDRVKELGDASVPFEFDVHAIILSDDAPALENQLHKHFTMSQVNKVNHRKEFFRASLADIRKEIDDMGIETKWTMLAEAREYRETLAIERAFAEDESAREAWLNRQLTLDPVEYRELVAVEDE